MIRVYIAGAIALAFAGVVILALWYRGEAIDATADAAKARASLASAVEANKQATDTIAELQEQARFDNRLAASVLEQVQAINKTLADQSAQLTDLETTNADVRKYLDAAVPADLCRLYNRC